MKQGWEIKTLGDLYEITSSKRVFQYEWKTSGVPFYRAREIVKLAQNGYVENELFISDEMYNEYSKKYGIPKEGDIMVTGVGTLGICYLVKSEDKFYFKDGNIIWLKTRGNINSRYVEYAFKSDYLRKQIDDSVGATVGTYTIIKAKSTKIPLPPLPEQQRIVAILDEAFAAISKAKVNAEQNLKNAKELFESYLQGVFENKGKMSELGSLGLKDHKMNDDEKLKILPSSNPKNHNADEGEGWEEKTLGELATFRNGMNFSKNGKGEKIYIVGVKDFKNSFWVPFETLEAVTLDGKLNELDQLNEGDIVAVRSNGNPQLIGRTLLASEVNGKVSHSGFTIRIRLNSKSIDPVYLCNFLKISSTRKILVDGGNGVGIKSLNQGSLSALIIPFPKSLKTQQTIVRKLDALSAETKKLQTIYQQKINDLEELKKSILQKAFSGEL